MIVPTLQELRTSIISDLEQALGITAAFQKKAIAAFADVQAAKLHSYYLSIAGVQKNIFIDTADSEDVGGTLERFGRVKLNRNPFPATQGVYRVQLTVETIGSVIPQGTTFRKSSNNALYATTAELTTTANPDYVTVQSLNAGTDFELFIGDGLVAAAPIVGVNSNAVVSSVTTEPNDAETTEQYRTLGLQAYRLEAQGGSTSDYRIWAADAQSIKQIYPFTTPVFGGLNIFAEADTPTLIPSASDLLELQAVIETDPTTGDARAPIAVWETLYLPVAPLPVDIVINGLNDNSASVITTIEAALNSYLLTIRPFIAGADDSNNIQDTLRLSGVSEVIQNSLAAGNYFSFIDLNVDGNPVTAYTFTQDEVPLLNTITAP